MSDKSNEIAGNPKKLGPAALHGIAEIFRVLADPGRLSLLQELKDGEKTVSELATGIHVGQPSVSKHLKVLADAGLLSRRKEGVKVFYSLKGELVFPLCQLVCEKLADDQENREIVDFSI